MNTIQNNPSEASALVNRRQFIQRSSLATAGAVAAAQFPYLVTTHAAPDDPIRVGVIGCGGRGTGAALNVLQAATKVVYPDKGYHTEDAVGGKVEAKNISIVALADMFPDRLASCRDNLKKVGQNIADDHCFTGFDAYKKLLALPDVNYIIHATPPHFRPRQVKAAIEAGKHVFLEKPAAVDGPGVRLLLEAGELARQKGLGIVAGTQRRHQANYVETIKRIQDGAVGELLTGLAYWNGGEIWVVERQPGWSDMEWQMRNWNYFTWLGGDCIVEQHLHSIDVINWVMNDHPVKASGMGGRQVRVDPIYGNVYDHFATEFEYADGRRMFSQCRQINGCTNNVSEWVIGTKGRANCSGRIYPKGGEEWGFAGRSPNAYEQEHVDLINSIRAGKPLNEAKAVAESTLTAIMGRVSAYTGQTLTWDEVLNSKEDLSPAKYELGPLPVPPVAMPGKTKFA
jgi:predicted dehydrogenase